MAGRGASDISHDLRMIAGVRPDMLLYGCTSATLTHGPSLDAQLAQDIRAFCGVQFFTAVGALVAAIESLVTKKVGFLSP